MADFKELTGFDEQTPEGIAAIQRAAKVIAASEELGNELESANYHSLTDNLLEFTQGLHVHTFPDPQDTEHSNVNVESWGIELECLKKGCWASKVIEDE